VALHWLRAFVLAHVAHTNLKYARFLNPLPPWRYSADFLVAVDKTRSSLERALAAMKVTLETRAN
jgi:hypothetical protein